MPVQPPVYLDLPLRKLTTTTALPGGLLLMALAVSHAAQAAEPAPKQPVSRQTTYQIRPQTLDRALVGFSLKSSLQVIADGKLTAGVKSPGVSGRYSTQQALQKLLAGTGVTVQSSRNGTVTLEKAVVAQPQSSAATASATTLKPMTVVGEAVQNPDDPYNTSYNVANASTATKIDTPIMETPFSVTVVPQQVLRDKQVIRVEDAITSVAGVQSSWTNGGTSDVFMIRGFQNTNLYRDSFLLPSALGGGTTKRQVANLERIEVLKGPGSILFGRNEPGGVINLVTKRPQATPYHSIQQQFGSYDFLRTTVDSTGAITSDDNLLYRVNFSYENANSFRDFVSTDDVFFAPSLTWNLSDQTQINMDIAYEHFNDKIDSGIPPMGNRPAPVPINRQIGDPLNNTNRGDRTYVGFNWSHAFNDQWKLAHRFGAEFLDIDKGDFTFFFGQPDAEGNLVNLDADFSNGGNRGFNNGLTQQQNYYTTLNLTGKFNTTPMLEHTTLWGFDYFVIDNQGSTACCAAYPIGANFNIFNPTYQTFADPLASAFTPISDFNQEWYGLYFQDQIKFPFNVYGNVGVRYDNASGTQYMTSGESVNTNDNHVSPRGGLLWRPINWLSVYGNYSQNFGPSNNQFNSPGQQILPPTLADEWELGAKTEFFEGRLSATFAYFDLTKNNIAVSDPNNPTLQIASGEQESRGYEFEVAGEILPGWKMLSAYTILDYAKINVGFNGGVDDDTGNRLYNAPRNYGSLWNTYEFQDAVFRGLKFGGGIIASSQSQGTNDNTFQLPGYVTLNLMTSYNLNVKGKNLTFQLNANNLLDKTYYSGTNTGSMIGVAAPRFFMGSIKLEF